MSYQQFTVACGYIAAFFFGVGTTCFIMALYNFVKMIGKSK
jgi:hypothetical protein